MGRERRLRNIFWRRRVRTDQRRDEGVGAGGGQLGSNARSRRSLAVAGLARALYLPWGRGLMQRRMGWVAAGGAARSGGGGPLDRPPPEKPNKGGFWKNIPVYPPSFEDR
jgi:hypothetical protein